MSSLFDTEPGVHVFDARGVARRFRHSAIFGALDALRNDETMRLVNDHDPIPLLAQIEQHRGEHIRITHRQRGPGLVVIDFIVCGLPEE